MPCSTRKVTSSTGASAPTWSCVGNRPMRVLVTPISTKVTTSTTLRPWRSPMGPKIRAPSGRERYSAAMVPNEANRANPGLSWLKNTEPNTSDAAVAYSMKS